MERTKNIAGFILLFVCLCGSVFATNYNCSSCSDCNNKINSASAGDIVYLTANITNCSEEICIEFAYQGPAENNITFDCQGNRIEGTMRNYSAGIELAYASRNTVKNCKVSSFWFGIYLLDGGKNTLTGNTANNNKYYGINLQDSNYNTLTENTVNNNSVYGINMYYSNNNTIINNTANNNSWYGIRLYNSSNNTLTRNTANYNNEDGIRLDNSNTTTMNLNHACFNINSDFYISGGIGNSGDDNTCDNPDGWNDVGATGCTYSCSGVTTTTCNSCSDCNNKINSASAGDTIYLMANITNQSGNCIEFDSKNRITFDCQGNSIEGIMDYPYFTFGIYLRYSSNNTITNCKISLFDDGIRLSYSNNNNLTGNRANNNEYFGIRLLYSNNNTLTNNAANNNVHYGIYLISSKNNTIKDNTANSNSYDGIHLIGYGSYGIHYNSDYNKIINNIVKNNQMNGLYIGILANNNTINANTFCSNNQFGGDYYDIYDTNSNPGDDNTCDTTENWNDEGTTGCTYPCSCSMAGDTPPCGEVTLSEVIDFINLWAQGQANLSDVINLINAWAQGT